MSDYIRSKLDLVIAINKANSEISKFMKNNLQYLSDKDFDELDLFGQEGIRLCEKYLPSIENDIKFLKKLTGDD